MDSAIIEAADHAARHWRFAGDWRPGDTAHREAFCRMLLDTFNPYKPAVIHWPALDAETRQRVISLPIWDIAVQTEGRARRRILSYARTVADPLLRQALEHMGFEEGRHKEVLSHLVAAYGIALEPEPEYLEPRDPEWGFMVTGYSECIDSFFAFGLFALARRSGFFPPELVETFEPVIQEEARHILLFANWLAWHRKRLNPWRRVRFELRVMQAWVFLAWERIGIARGMDSGAKQDNNFTLNGSQAVSDIDLSPLDLMAICLTENDRRFAGYDPRLLRPTTTPALARLAVRVGRLFRRPSVGAMGQAAS
jgi:hypothetical protein